MVDEKVYNALKVKGFGDRITEHKETIDTVEHAAQQIGCSEAEIAKTLSFIVDEKPVVVVMAGDGRVNSSKFKAQFHTKPSMVPRDRVEELIGFLPGGVCPFGVDKSIPVWLDVSMKRFDYVHPAAGNEFTSVTLSPEELQTASDAIGWCDVCKGWEDESK
ncbi:YbaK/EbsC family protein [Butyrivibrio sp. VCD2006]|uniref:YbaK/EbsC family protein n=1 Tax=Butyrivibrio sp. VCD2006 TaxID=1280664 RepID=UPI00040B87DE|nr:YbaK/EbsC family protein [Butyrivibrio sp. VCD2006]